MFQLTSWTMICAPVMFILAVIGFYFALWVYTPIILQAIGLGDLIRHFDLLFIFGIIMGIINLMAFPFTLVYIYMLMKLWRYFPEPDNNGVRRFLGEWFTTLFSFIGVPYLPRQIREQHNQAQLGQIKYANEPNG